MGGSETASMIPRWYSAREVNHCPGSALLSGESFRYRSAHWLTVSFGGGFTSHAVSLFSFDIALCTSGVICMAEFIECFHDHLLQHPLDLGDRIHPHDLRGGFLGDG